MLQDENIPEPEKEIPWERYEYVNIDVKGCTKRKLMLIKQKTAAKEMFTYFRSQLESFTQHQFSANWQINQLNVLKQCLPENTCLVINDYLENYRCIEKDELQSGYFGKNEVSIHVSVIYHHAVDEYEHLNENELVSELIFCISPDGTHDHFFVAKDQ
ncbi:hypothetical protein DPMN_153323 [Dreissena polymorpha]|uniref:Uncharacterized protein n=1 Tax=Dreissena polymorpha TaxID=45954 RepID=A0A9D4FKM1_DREPO|nr:hypothetical protein DPMN_153323 [Dreissena polymorpha]